MTLATGQTLGPYRVVAKVGEGGMGVVYRSHDTALHRDVAIKILPDILALDPDRLARLSREAQTLAALSHPHIAQVYGLVELPVEAGVRAHALVMEWVDGDDLAQRIAHGPIPPDDALPIARQIAEALEAAHEQGITHRDIKPANIKVKPDGTVKVLDFGLAKAADPVHALSGTGPITSPTMTSPALTAMGIILGTAAYMSPEQARGKPVDRRADIWAFGVVLTEMLTGRRVFQGETVSDVMVSVLSGPIDLSGLPPNVPSRVRDVIARCLERDSKRRLRDIGEARVALENGSAVSAAAETNATKPRPTGLPWALAGLSLAVAAITGTLWFRSVNPPRASERLFLEIGPPAGEELVIESNAGAAAISPDGSLVTFLAQGPAGRRLYIRSLVTGEARAISGTDEASYPFWSPDSRSLAFFGTSKLMTVSVAGGLPEAVADIEQGRGGTWSDSGVILFTPRGGGVVHRVGERGGPVAAITTLDESRGENAHYWPVALPGGREFLFFIRSQTPENNGIYIGSLDGKTAPVRLVTSLSSGLYTPSRDGEPGYVLWVRDGELLAQRLDIAGRRLTGDVATVASDVRVEESQRGIFASVSTNGTIVWPSAKAADKEFAWYSREGRKLETLPLPPGKLMQPALSPDGRKLAFTRAARGTADIWLLDLESSTPTQFTTDPGYDESPAWSPDGRTLVYDGRVAEKAGVVLAPIDASQPSRVFAEHGMMAGEAQFIPQRRALLFVLTRDQQRHFAIARLDGAGGFEDLASDRGYVGQAAPSPDGQWLAFVTDRTGRMEVVLSRFVEDGGRLQLNTQRVPVTSAGGIDPHWRADGREILYVGLDRTLTAVSVLMQGQTVSLGKAVRLFRLPADAGGSGANWGANADHSKFVVVDTPQRSVDTFRVLTNWQSAAKP